VFGALDEALEVGGRAEIPVHVSHLKCESAGVWGLAERLLERIHDAPDATADQYPYTAWNSSLESLLPPWAPVADAPLLDMKDRERLRTAVEHGEPGFQSAVEGVGWDRIVIESSGEGRWNGTDVATIADALQTDPFDVFLELLADDPNTSCIGHAMREDDVFAILSDPEVFVASDASAIDPEGLGGDQPVHPRSYGTFPRALQLARDRKLLALENIVRKMTSLPSDRFGLEDRGRIEAGARADLVVFEPAAVEDRATFEAPHAYPEGMDLVVVNGVVAWDAASPTSIERAGRVLRRGA
jgi:N-acyl-D-aspartate/D-glutamate deacylase